MLQRFLYTRRMIKRFLLNLITIGILFWAAFFPAISPASTQALDTELRHALVKAINESNSFEDRYIAEIWLSDMSLRLKKRIKDARERLLFLKTLHHEAARTKLYPEVVLAVIEVESNFDRYALSVSGARGYMQIMPFWLKEIGRPKDDLFNMKTNLRLGCTILKYYLNKEKGDLRKALARYNGSTGKRKYPDKVFNALSKRWYRQ